MGAHGSCSTLGEDIWESKIKSQGEVGVVFGVYSDVFGEGKRRILNQTRRTMVYFDRYVKPLLPNNGTILDAGIGPLARFSVEFAKRGFGVDGLDISKSTLAFAKKHAGPYGKTIQFVHGDMTKYISKHAYSLIFCFETFFHIPPPSWVSHYD
ncbi:MAG: class I SAM-dependent methyltransferase [Nanoarchaeota archaeon]|nr:class I SAM-dependent methyltransferase [Nanoarchaeota archaeon]